MDYLNYTSDASEDDAAVNISHPNQLISSDDALFSVSEAEHYTDTHRQPSAETAARIAEYLRLQKQEGFDIIKVCSFVFLLFMSSEYTGTSGLWQSRHLVESCKIL